MDWRQNFSNRNSRQNSKLKSDLKSFVLERYFKDFYQIILISYFEPLLRLCKSKIICWIILFNCWNIFETFISIQYFTRISILMKSEFRYWNIHISFTENRIYIYFKLLNANTIHSPIIMFQACFSTVYLCTENWKYCTYTVN